MTRSEEELRVGKTSRESGRARLRKYVVTEQVQKTVPVQREEVRVEREPITDANVGDAKAGPAISEEEHEVTLHEEEVVTEKRAVPKERVRLDKETVTDDQTVSEEVRKEQIEAEGAGTEGRGKAAASSSPRGGWARQSRRARRLKPKEKTNGDPQGQDPRPAAQPRRQRQGRSGRPRAA